MSIYKCPKCKSDLRAGKIPQEIKHLYGKDVEFFSKVIGVYDNSEDRTTHWLCPMCNHRWKR